MLREWNFKVLSKSCLVLIAHEGCICVPLGGGGRNKSLQFSISSCSRRKCAAALTYQPGKGDGWMCSYSLPWQLCSLQTQVCTLFVRVCVWWQTFSFSKQLCVGCPFPVPRCPREGRSCTCQGASPQRLELAGSTELNGLQLSSPRYVLLPGLSRGWSKGGEGRGTPFICNLGRELEVVMLSPIWPSWLSLHAWLGKLKE